MPPPMIRTTRPMHIETLFQDRSRAPSLTSSHRSGDSLDSSAASPTNNRFDTALKYHELRAETPCFDDSADRSSLRSFALSFSFKKPRWTLFKKLHRRGQSAMEVTPSAQEASAIPRKMSLTSLAGFHSRQNSSMLTLNTKPASPTQLESVPELSSRKCYYSIARNCPGWVIGGSHGDACEACLVCHVDMTIVNAD